MLDLETILLLSWILMSRHVVRRITHPDGSTTIVYDDGTHDLLLAPIDIQGIVPRDFGGAEQRSGPTMAPSSLSNPQMIRSMRGLEGRQTSEGQRMIGGSARSTIAPSMERHRISNSRFTDLSRLERRRPWFLLNPQQQVDTLRARLSADYRDLREFSALVRRQLDHWTGARETSPDAPFLGVPVGLLRSALVVYDNTVEMPATLSQLPETLNNLLTAISELLSELSRDPVKIIPITQQAPWVMARLLQLIGESLFGPLIQHIREASAAAETGDQLTLSSRIIEITADILQLILFINQIVTLLQGAGRFVVRMSSQLENIGATVARIRRDLGQPNSWWSSAQLRRRASEIGEGPGQTLEQALAETRIGISQRSELPVETTHPPLRPRPAQVESIEARGRTLPPQAEGRSFSTVRLRDQHGDRFTWTRERDGSALVEVTMRYEPEHLTQRGPQHRPSSVARHRAREATVSEGGAVRFDAGHVRAAVLDGIAEAINSFPQSRSINRGAWQIIEGRVRRLLSNMRDLALAGSLSDPSLTVNLKFRYSSLGTRTPEDFLVSIRAPGSPTVRLRVANHPRLGYTVEAWRPSDRIQDFYGRAGIGRLRSASEPGLSE